MNDLNNNMVLGRNNPSAKVRLLVSDIDGTLVTHNKEVTKEALAAVEALKKAGIGLCLVSSRPPQGIQLFFKELGLNTPFAALNGGEIISGGGSIVMNTAMDFGDACDICDLLRQHDVGAWVFGGFDWYVFDMNNDFIQHEASATNMKPQLITDLHTHKQRITKIEGVNANTALLDELAAKINSQYHGKIKALRSSDHYLDITHPNANKGFAAVELGKQLGVDITEIACIGDMDNDIPMLEIAGVSIAMGQSIQNVCQHAHFQTKSNEDNGWAYAVKHYILPRA